MSKQGSCVEIDRAVVGKDRAVVGNHRWQQWIIGKAAVIEMAYRRRVRSMIHQLTTAAGVNGVNWVIHALMVLGNAVDWLTHSVSPSSSRTCSLTASVFSLFLPCHHFSFLPFVFIFLPILNPAVGVWELWVWCISSSTVAISKALDLAVYFHTVRWQFCYFGL